MFVAFSFLYMAFSLKIKYVAQVQFFHDLGLAHKNNEYKFLWKKEQGSFTNNNWEQI